MFRSTLKMPSAHAAGFEKVQRENAPTMTSTSTPQEPWTLPRAAYQASDPLTDCLVILTRFFQRPFSAQTLTAGLPLEQGRLTPELFTRAADRAGISARIMRRALKDISPNTFPAVLLLKDGSATVAIGCDAETRVWRFIDPDSGGGETTLPQDELEARYAGSVIYVKPGFRYDERVGNYELPRPENWFWGVVQRAWPLYSEVLIASFLINVFALLSPLFIMNVYDRVVPNEAYETLWVLAIGLVIAYCFDLLMRTLRGYFLDVAGKQVDVIFLSNIFEQILALRSEVRPRSVGNLVNTLQEFDGFRDMITSATIATLIDLPFAFLFLAVIWWVGGWVVVVPLLTIPLAIFVGLALQGPLSSRVRKVMMAVSQKQSILIETLSGIETVKTMRAESRAQRQWEQTIGEIERHGLASKLLSTLISNISAFLQNISVVFVVVVGVYQIAAHNISVGALIACSLLVTRAIMPFSQIAALMTRYYQVTSALRGIDNIMGLPTERPRGKSFVHRQNIVGDIEFRNVSFYYPEQEIGALHDISFSIKAGERVGIIGRVGSGKTTLHKLLLGLYQPISGSVWLDGLDLNQMDPADIRHNVGYVPQDVYLFFGSVRDNIMMSAQFQDDEAMLRAAQIAGVMDFVKDNPKGFDMQLGERGERLSGGQRQAIAVARALLTDPPLLLLDEPTNSLDNRSEENFKARLANCLTPRHTVVLITHRSSLLSLVDRLIVLEGGRIVADGPKQQVLDALSGGNIRVQSN